MAVHPSPRFLMVVRMTRVIFLLTLTCLLCAQLTLGQAGPGEPNPDEYTDEQVSSCSTGGTSGGGGVTRYSTPLLLDIEGDGYELTDAYYGVPFDISGTGRRDQVSWTTAASDDAWLVLDRNGNGKIDGGQEMFGDASEQPVETSPRNGFASLAVFDSPNRGGNGDGVVDNADAVFSLLRLWQDKNHNGVAEPAELFSLPALGAATIDLRYHVSKRTDEYGNQFRFRAKVDDVRKARIGRWVWDVFLLVNHPPG